MAGSFGVILVPTDGSDDAILALQIATYVGDPYSYTGALPNDFFAICEEAGRATLAREAERASALGATVAQTHLLQGRPADVIVEAAREIGADLIVVGSRGHGPPATAGPRQRLRRHRAPRALPGAGRARVGRRLAATARDRRRRRFHHRR